MAKIHYGVKTSRKQGGPKKAKIQYGAKPDIFKYALFSDPGPTDDVGDPRLVVATEKSASEESDKIQPPTSKPKTSNHTH